MLQTICTHTYETGGGCEGAGVLRSSTIAFPPALPLTLSLSLSRSLSLLFSLSLYRQSLHTTSSSLIIFIITVKERGLFENPKKLILRHVA